MFYVIASILLLITVILLTANFYFIKSWSNVADKLYDLTLQMSKLVLSLDQANLPKNVDNPNLTIMQDSITTIQQELVKTQSMLNGYDAALDYVESEFKNEREGNV